MSHKREAQFFREQCARELDETQISDVVHDSPQSYRRTSPVTLCERGISASVMRSNHSAWNLESKCRGACTKRWCRTAFCFFWSASNLRQPNRAGFLSRSLCPTRSKLRCNARATPRMCGRHRPRCLLGQCHRGDCSKNGSAMSAEAV